MTYRALDAFEALFKGTFFNHRVHTNGDRVSINVFEDIDNAGLSPKFVSRASSQSVVANVTNTNAGVIARRPDGTLGHRVQHIAPTFLPTFSIARGQTVSTEIGIEVKIMSKAMVRQRGRVSSDLAHGARDIKASNPLAITVALVGVNHAQFYVSREGDQIWRTTGSGRYLHPFQEADSIEPYLRAKLGSAYDEIIFLHFVATNEDPFPFSWRSVQQTNLAYGAMIGRIAQAYEQRF